MIESPFVFDDEDEVRKQLLALLDAAMDELLIGSVTVTTTALERTRLARLIEQL